jgi:hypothetical protein
VCGLQLALIAGQEPTSSYVEIRTLRPNGCPGPREFIPVRKLREATQCVQALAAQTLNVYVGAAPRVRKGGAAPDVERVHCLWADLDTPASVEAARRFRPSPSIAVCTSAGRLQVFWALGEPIPPDFARRALRRLALALGADRAAAEPARIVRAIGSRNLKYSPPPVVTCVRCELELFAMAEVVGGLADAPEYISSSPRREITASDPDATLAGLARTVATAPRGNRNNCLHWAACRALEHVEDGDLDADAAREALTEAAREAGLEEAAIAATVRSGMRRRAAA